MKKLKNLSFIIFTYLIIASSHAQTEDNECSILHDGTFYYGKRKDKIVVIDDNILTENWGYGQFIITSNIVWINDCEYYSTILKVSRANYKYNVGDRLHVKITNIIENRIYYEASKTSYTWSGHFTKKKEKEEK